jgi:hypothetical protein
VWNAVVPRRTIGYGPACDSWDAGVPGCLPYRCHRRSSRWYDGYAIPEDVSNLWICYPLGVRESHQRG